jgi:hypothetical protein
MDTPYSSLAQGARTQELKKARSILWIVGLLTIAVNGFMLGNSKNELETAVSAELGKSGTSLAAVRALPDAQRAEFDRQYATAFGKIRLIYGAGVALGVIFIVCALFVEKKPVASTVTGLVLYLGSIAALMAFDPSTLVKGIIVRVFIVIGLVSSVKSALAIERERRTQAGG